MSFLSLSKMASKLAADSAAQQFAMPTTQLAGSSSDVKNGFEGRMGTPPVGAPGFKKMQGPRAYAPRLNQPSV